MVSWPGYVCTATNSVSTTGNQAPSQATNHKPAAGAASDAPSRHPHPTTRVQATANTAPRILPLFAASRHDKHDYIHRALTKTSMFFLLYHCPGLAATPSSAAGAYMPKGSSPLQGAADKTAGACLFSRQAVESQLQVQCTQTPGLSVRHVSCRYARQNSLMLAYCLLVNPVKHNTLLLDRASKSERYRNSHTSCHS